MRTFMTYATLLSLLAIMQFALAEQTENVSDALGEGQSPNLKVSISASWPQSEIFGIKVDLISTQDS